MPVYRFKHKIRPYLKKYKSCKTNNFNNTLPTAKTKRLVAVSFMTYAATTAKCLTLDRLNP